VSKSLVLEDVFVPGGADLAAVRRLSPRRGRLAAHVLQPGADLHGIARAAVAFTAAYLREAGTAGSAAKQFAVAEMRLKLEQAEALFHRVIAEARPDPGKDARMRAYAAQYTIMEQANDICRLAIRTCGGRSIAKAMPLERLLPRQPLRRLMLPWTAEICLERLGRETLEE